MHLSDLIEANQGAVDHDMTIKGITQDSRRVRPGYLYAALPGSKANGVDYVADAVRNGAVAVLVPQGATLKGVTEDTAVIESENVRRDLSLAAARWFGAQPDFIAAVTGTNGKTSTSDFVQQILNRTGHKAASLGTLGIRGAGMHKEGALTTPDPVWLHGQMADLAAAGITHLSLEASSHGLDQFRLDGVRVRAAGFTNLTRDHLDYHQTMEQYRAAKARLFSDVLDADGTAVLNADSDAFDHLREICAQRGIKTWSYGVTGEDMRIVSASARPDGQAVTLDLFGKTYETSLPLVGAFQVKNALCALGLVMAAGDVPVEAAIEALQHLQGAPGRLQLVGGHPRGAAVYVDYAHTPDAVETILVALRPHTRGRLICLVGCGGDRDPGKRPMMAKEAAEHADIVVVTDDNPRSEDPAKIRAAMMEGAPDAKNIGGRREAIRWAVNEAQEGDVVVLAGKGHERGQIVGGRVLPFDDVEEAQNAIKAI